MDFLDALTLWPLMGKEYKLEAINLKKGYTCWFVKDRVPQGHFVTKGGFSWDYPQELLDKFFELKNQGITAYDYKLLKQDQQVEEQRAQVLRSDFNFNWLEEVAEGRRKLV